MMYDALPLVPMLEVAASHAPLLDRARSLVESLETWLPVDAIWLTLSDPGSTALVTIGSSGLEQPVLDYLQQPSVAAEIRLADLNRERPPICVTELPVPVGELPTWADCLIPAGFENGLVVPLCEPGGPFVGMLSLLFTDGAAPPTGLRRELARLAPAMARTVSPLRSLLATARLAEGARHGAVLMHDGTTFPLPGLEDHPLLVDGSGIVDLARRSLVKGEVHRSFMWPCDGGPDPAGGHVGVTVLAATDVPALVLGIVLVRPEVECGGLTPRELEVLGWLVEGCSNQQIARRLAVTSRTVATHLEHILHKLDVPSRTLAAVRAEREGWHVPPIASSGSADAGVVTRVDTRPHAPASTPSRAPAGQR